MSFLKLYARVLSLLSAALPAAIALVVANLGLAVAQFAEPLLFGKVIDRLSAGLKDLSDIAPLVAAWAGFGLFSIAASVLVSLYAAGSPRWPAISAMSWACPRSITRSPIRAGCSRS